MDAKTIDRFEKVDVQLMGFLAEFQSLTKKSPKDAVNTFKLKYLNEVLAEANAVLPVKSRPFADFEQFDSDSLPTNSDVVMILRQYSDCMEQVRERDTFKEYGTYYWSVDGAKGAKKQTRDPRLRR